MVGMEAGQNYTLKILVPSQSAGPHIKKLKAFSSRLARERGAAFSYSAQGGAACFAFSAAFESRFDIEKARARFFRRLATQGIDYQNARIEIIDGGLLLDDLLKQLAAGFPNRTEIVDSYRVEYLEPAELRKLRRGEIQSNSIVKSTTDCAVQPPEPISIVAERAASVARGFTRSLEDVLFGIRMLCQGVEVAYAGPFIDRYGNNVLNLGLRVYAQPRATNPAILAIA